MKNRKVKNFFNHKKAMQIGTAAMAVALGTAGGITWYFAPEPVRTTSEASGETKSIVTDTASKNAEDFAGRILKDTSGKKE